MRNYIILNNKKSDTISGLIIQELPAISKPAQRTQVETIDGRDGDIITPLGYAAYNKKIKIGLYGTFDINEIIAYFATQGQVIFSNEPNKYYNYQIVDQIDYDRLVRYRVATVTMHVQPFKYSSTETPIIVDSSDTVSGEGSDIALANTAEAPFNVLRHKGNATQTTTSGKNKLAYTLDQLKTINDGLGRTWTDNQCEYNGVTFTVNDDLTISATGTASGAAYFLINTAIALESGVDYIMTGCPSGGSTSTYTLRLYSGGSYTNETGSGINFTYGSQDIVRVNIPNGSQVNGVVFKPMIRLASISDDSYEPYTNGASPNPDYPQDIQVVTGNQTVKICGKNLLEPITNFSRTSAFVDFVYQDDGGININGTATGANAFSITAALAPSYTTLPAGTYVLSGTTISSNVQLRIVDAVTGVTVASITTAAQAVFTLTEQTDVFYSIRVNQNTTVNNKTVYFQVERGNQATLLELYKGQKYVIPFGDTYLAKVGNYADEPVKVDGTWYIRRAIGKAVFDGSSDESWADYTTYYGCNASLGGIANQAICNYYTLGGQSTPKTFWTTANAFRTNDLRASLADYKTWLSTHNLEVYYVLATSTDEAITDQDLIDALDDYFGQAHAYKGQTNITVTPASGDAPAVLSVNVNEDNESTVTNAGNTTSRPILTIYGQGDIGVYINDVEVLQVALNDEGYITLDSVEMEAYKDSTANLKNRLVTGDYSKLALNAGANKIRFTGIVTKYEISKYSRWL